MTRKDSYNRVWDYCDSEGTWQHGPHLIGCGGKNGSKWMVWSGPCASSEEFKTLREAMLACCDRIQTFEFGQTLQNGATIVEAKQSSDYWIVIARYLDQFVTWQCDSKGYSNCGRYFGSIVEAVADYSKRQ